jgi:hypothetical protein
MLATLATGWTSTLPATPEVHIPMTRGPNDPTPCGSTTTCSHDTWVRLRDFWQANPAPVLFDDFNGVDIDPSIWTRYLHPTYSGTSVTVSGGELRCAVGAGLNTAGKVQFSGSKIVVEAVMGDAEPSFLLVDTQDPMTGISANMIHASNTTYRGWGFSVQTDGRYAIIGPTTAGAITVAEGGNVLVNWIHNPAMMYYRLTVEGDVVTYERGVTADAITERLSTKMASSINGRPMSLIVGTGVGPYTPGRFQWIKVSTVP